MRFTIRSRIKKYLCWGSDQVLMELYGAVTDLLPLENTFSQMENAKKVKIRDLSIDYPLFSHGPLKKDCHRYLLLIFELSRPIQSMPHGSI